MTTFPSSPKGDREGGVDEELEEGHESVSRRQETVCGEWCDCLQLSVDPSIDLN